MNIAAGAGGACTRGVTARDLIANQIDYLGGMPIVTPKPVKTSEKAEEMLRFDLDNENETVRHYRDRVRQCDALGEFAMAEHIREILMQEQDHQIALATALGIDVPNVNSPGNKATRNREPAFAALGAHGRSRAAVPQTL